MTTGPLPLWLIAAGMFLAMLAACWAGIRLRRFAERRWGDGTEDENEKSGEGYVFSGVFGLLALLMAFAFSLAIGRYEERRTLVVEEAEAVGTMANYLALLPGDARKPLSAELARYAALRVKAGRAVETARWEEASTEAERSGEAFGRQLYAAIQAMPPDPRLTVLAPAYSAMTDVATARHAARSASLPMIVIALLALYCVAGAAMLGYAQHGSTSRRSLPASLPASLVFFLLLACAFVTVVDLDRPRGGLVEVSQLELAKVSRELAARQPGDGQD